MRAEEEGEARQEIAREEGKSEALCWGSRVTPYTTLPEALGIPAWVAFGEGLEITQSPLLDSSTGLAHLTYRQALDVAIAQSARLPTHAEVRLLHDIASGAGTELEPVILPGASPELVKSGARPGDPAMVGWDWCAIHDSLVVPRIRQLIASHPDMPIANAGKHWIGPAPAGLAALCGWWVHDLHDFEPQYSGPGFIQEGSGCPHNDQHSDYATTTVLVRPKVKA